MRLAFLVIALAACSSHASAGPAWPKSTAHETDGGESLAPRAAARTIAAKTDDDDDDKPVTLAVPGDRPAATPVAPGAGSAGDRPAASTPGAPDEPVTAEDIVIEIED